MLNPISTSREGKVLFVTCDNPPVNALGQAVRSGLILAIAQAETDDVIEAVVIRCADRTFFAGADITEFGKPMATPLLPQVVDAIEACSKPVVAAIHGTAFGGGCEIALACHYRIAVASAKLGLPEVKLGLIPGAGGTQRLPKLVGIEQALNIIVNGNPVSAVRAKAIGLIDRLASDGGLDEAALAFAQDAIGKPIRRSSEVEAIRGDANNSDQFDDFRSANARMLSRFLAPEAAIQALEVATKLPYREGVKRERQLFVQLMEGDQSKAMRHYFFAERLAGKVTGLAEDVSPRPIKSIGVIGAGTMGGGIAMNFLSAGLPVVILDMQQEALERGVATIRRNYESSVKKGRMSMEQVEAAMDRLSTTVDFADLDLYRFCAGHLRV